MRLRHGVIVELQRQLESVASEPAPSTPEGLIQAAQEARSAVERGRVSAREAGIDFDASVEHVLSKAEREHGVDSEGHPRLPPADVAAIRRARKALAGKLESTLDHQLESYLSETKERINASTVDAKRRSMEAFTAWFGGDRDGTEVTRREVGRYVSEVMLKRVKKGGSPHSVATRKKEISDLRAWFDWMLERGVIEVNPVDRMSKTVKGSTRGKQKPRELWSLEELTTLFHGVKPEDPMWSLAAIAVYTGMRREEVGELRKSSVDGEVLKVGEGKNEAAIRRVPIHPAIAPLIAQLEATTTDDYLIPGLSRGGPDKRRGWNVGKRFGRRIRKLGITDPGIVFHTLRNTFSNAMEKAGVPESTAELLVGHTRDGMTYGTYSKDLPDSVKREAVLKLSCGPLDSYIAGEGAKVVIAKPPKVRKARE